MTLFSLESLRLDPAQHRPPEVEEIEICELVASELVRLPAHERDAITAYARLSHESCRAVARRYGRSPQTICNWASAAIKKLRPKLERCR
jgi:hypothetical protein